ncbi:MAG: cupin domain-containing protein, partial [Anaerolineae bacterium]|nr:cupin domain-containing protein [Anaerolineae bacterium]NIN97324.1 cupin domain-containing protein [Anaerolineae bacterium]NIQ80244.1 cupin domain-containing protein [Anaerolineae bacterium]
MPVEDRKRKRDWSGRVHSLPDLVTYHTGSVVSRTIVEKETGTVTVFAFDEGEGLSEHTAPFDALVHVLEGFIAIDIAGKPHQMRGGDILILPAHQPHALQAV